MCSIFFEIQMWNMFGIKNNQFKSGFDHHEKALLKLYIQIRLMDNEPIMYVSF